MNKILDRDTITREYFATYTPLVKQFCENKDVREIAKKYPFNEHNCAPAPFLPIIGNGYYTAPIRVAIYGMETLRWHDLSKFIEKFQAGSLPKVKSYTDGIEGVVNPRHIESRFLNNYALPWHEKNNFWGFVYSVIAGIYGVKEKEIKERPDLLRSFIWGNVNAYERYDQTPQDVKMEKDDWQKVFKASECFNSAQLLLPYTHPQIMVVFHWAMTRKWLTGKDGDWEPSEIIPFEWQDFSVEHSLTEEQTKNLVHYIRCYYLVESKTFVLRTMHPSRMNRGGKKGKENGMDYKIWKKAIKLALKQIMQDSRFFSQS